MSNTAQKAKNSQIEKDTDDDSASFPKPITDPTLVPDTAANVVNFPKESEMGGGGLIMMRVWGPMLLHYRQLKTTHQIVLRKL